MDNSLSKNLVINISKIGDEPTSLLMGDINGIFCKYVNSKKNVLIDNILKQYINSIVYNNADNISLYKLENLNTDMSFMVLYELITNLSVLPEQAFANAVTLNSIKLPANIKEIGNSAFNNCSELSSIYFPSVTKLGSYVFDGCHKLTGISLSNILNFSEYALANCGIKAVSLNNSLIGLPKGLFSNCKNLYEFVNENITYLSDETFAGCSSLRKVKVSPSLSNSPSNYKINDGIDDDVPSGGGEEEPIIKQNVLLENNYSNNDISEVTLFYNEEGEFSLENIINDDRLSESYEENEWQICYILKEDLQVVINFKNTNEQYKSYTTFNAFEKNRGYMNNDIQANQNEIVAVYDIENPCSEEYTFERIEGEDTDAIKIITELNYYLVRANSQNNNKILYYLEPSVLETIKTNNSDPENTKRNLSIELLDGTEVSLNDFDLSNSDNIKFIIDNDFVNENTGGTMYYTVYNIDFSVVGYEDTGDHTWKNTASEADVTSLQSRWYKCKSIADNTLKFYVKPQETFGAKNTKSSKKGNMLFGAGSANYIMPNNLFNGCYNLTDVSFMNNISQVSVGSFCNCTALTDVPENLTSVLKFGFKNCEKITSINLSNCTNIGSYSFENCFKLVSVNLPSSITDLSNRTGIFMNCENLRTLGRISSANNIVDTDIALTKVGDYMFYNCSKLEYNKINLLEEIGNYSFVGCKNLPEVINAANFKKIGKYAFNNCASISEFKISNTTNGHYALPEDCTIDEGAFSNCSSLTQIKINTAFTEKIPDKLFSNCTSLQSIEFTKPINIEFTVDENENYEFNLSAFNNCPKLSNIILTEGNDFKSVNDNCIVYTGNEEYDIIVYVAKNISRFTIDNTFGSKELRITDNAFDGCKIAVIEMNRTITEDNVAKYSAPMINKYTFNNIYNYDWHILIKAVDLNYKYYSKLINKKHLWVTNL